jgi:NAD(P)-dependent dehydrogenase (short-subunit alcohol dehydrogenase family)
MIALETEGTPMSLAGRVALVTGGSRGIGRGIALGLAEDGADIVVNYRKDEAAAKETVAAIEALGRRARAYPGTVDSYDDCKALVDSAVRDFGFVDILINNAGIASRGNTVKNTDPLEFERVVKTHTFGAFYLSQLVIPSMRTRPRGDIVMISSVATLGMSGGGAPYNVGKAGMEALALTLAKEEKKHGIHVNIVAPGLVETDMGVRLAKATMGVQDIRQLDAAMPFGRVCQPEDIANAVRFLVSDRASYITGEKVNVWGGGSA